MKRSLNLFIFLLLLIPILILFTNLFSKKSYVVAGTANPGEIYLYEYKKGKLEKTKSIDTGYKFVYTVRIGDIYNNRTQQIIAGVSNSFFTQAEPYGCKVLAYDLVNFKQSVIDEVSDLRCKDLTIGDADNDGQNEVLLGTHGMGIVRLYKWVNNSWVKEDLEKNFIAQIDEKEKTNHRVPNSELSCQDCVVQSAVHIVKIGDVDNDGKNEVLATISSPLELQKGEEISFVKVYERDGSSWKSEIIDRISNREFRSITIGDIYDQKRNTLLIGIGSPREEKGSLYTYEWRDNKWEKKSVHNDQEEKNMKGVTLGDIYNNGQEKILLATGFPKAQVAILDWQDDKFATEKVGSISSLFDLPDAEFNSMVSLVAKEKRGPATLIVGGMTTFPKQKIGWEGTKDGFVVLYRYQEGSWKAEVLERRNILGMDQSFQK